MDRFRPTRWVLLWMAAVVVGAVVLGVLWSRSDYANTSLRTAASEPVAAVDAAPPDRLSTAWSASTGPADAGVVEDSTVIVGEEHGVRGLDPATGDERWHYLRSTALLCDWTAQDGVVVAVFRNDRGCEEALALDAGTGQRQWYRSVNYTSEVALQSTNQLTVASTPTGITVLGTTTNGMRWRYDPPADCLIGDSMPGDVGVAVVVTCETSSRLVLLDGFNGKERWTGTLPAGAASILTADEVVAVLALDLAGSLHVFDRDGVALVDLREQAIAAADDGQPSAVLVGERLAVFTGSTLFTVNVQSGGIDWVAPALARPVLLASTLLTYDGTDFVEHDVVTGAVLRRITADGVAPPTGGWLERFGAAIVVSTPDEVAVYR